MVLRTYFLHENNLLYCNTQIENYQKRKNL